MPLDYRKNPSPKMFNTLDMEWEIVRGSLIGDDLYIWDGSLKDHQAASKEIGIDYFEQFPLFLEEDNFVASGIDATRWVKMEDSQQQRYNQIATHPAMKDILSTGYYTVEGLSVGGD